MRGERDYTFTRGKFKVREVRSNITSERTVVFQLVYGPGYQIKIAASMAINRIQARIFLSYSSQCETSEMRVSIERPCKKPIIMRIHSIMRICSCSLDQEADTVWVMSLNFAHLFVMRIYIYNVYSRACAKPQEIPIMHL